MLKKKSKLPFITVLIRDAFFCASFIYLMLQAIQLVPLNSAWFQPASNAFKDFDWSDIYFSKIKHLNNSSVQNQNIVVINIENATRAEIAATLLKLNNVDVKVIGLDVLFRESKDSISDALLDSSIVLFGRKIVVACYADSTDGNKIYSIQPAHVPKAKNTNHLGYVNFIGNENETVRAFYETQSYKKEKIGSFALNTFLKYHNQQDFSTANDHLKSDKIIIPYQSKSEHYTTFSYHEIVDSTINFEILRTKIVLIGYGGSSDGSTVIDDKHFTPLNENYAGKALPDMFGIYIHANIIEAYINNYTIFTPPRFLQILVCIVVICLFLILYLYWEREGSVWQNIIEIILQLLFGFVILMLAIYFLSSNGIKWDIGEMIAAVALAEALVGVYKVIIYYLSKVYNFKSIFKNED